MTSELISRVDYALETAEKLARGPQTWLTVKQTAWLHTAIKDAIRAGANGSDRPAMLYCGYNIHPLITLYIAPNHCGSVTLSECQCGKES